MKWKMCLVSCLAVVLLSVGVAATVETRTAELYYKNIKISLNGEEIIPRGANGDAIEPFIIDGTTYLPVRGIASALGLNVGWDSATNTVLLSDGDNPAPPSTDPLEKQIEVEEYSYMSQYSDYKRYFMLLTNRSNQIVDIDVNVLALNAEGAKVGAFSDREIAIAPGQTTWVEHSFSDGKDVSGFEYTLTVSENVDWKSLYNKIKVDYTISNNKVIISMTNNGDREVDLPYVGVVFLRNGEAVDSAAAYISNGIPTGRTVHTELTCDDVIEFDDIKLAMSGLSYYDY